MDLTDNLSHFPSTYVSGFHNEGAVSRMRYNTLGNTGLQVSHLGLGGATCAICSTSYDEEEAIKAMIEAVRSGINYIDTAPYYGEGKAEIILGKALRCIPRETYYIATKVGRYTKHIPTMFDFTAERTKHSVRESLQRLGLTYVDMIQVHDIEFAPNPSIIVTETLPALEELKNAGLCKFIGITGYPISELQKILEMSTVKIDLVLSYCRCTLFDNTLLDYIEKFKSHGLGIINAAALGMGLLTNAGPPSWHPVKSILKSACAEAAKYCQEKNVDIAKLAVYYTLSQSQIDTNLIGMSNCSVLQKNLEVLFGGLTDYEHDILKQIKEKYFTNIVEKHWENVEVQKYWDTIRKSPRYNN